MSRRLLSLLSLLVMGLTLPVFAAPTPEQRKELEGIPAQLKEAGELFKANKFPECGEVLKQLQGKIAKLAAEGDASVHRQLEPHYKKLQNAYSLLELEGIELPKLEPLGSPVKPTKPEPKKDAPAAGGGVSFVKQVVPLLITKCGGCHVTQVKGGFGMPHYAGLMKGPMEGIVVRPSDADGSRLIEVIESGDMPRGGGKLSPAEFAMLKQWINEGAKFDGNDPNAALASLLPAGTAPMPEKIATPTIMAATGKETVSFGLDIAPHLAKSCIGCHGTDNPRANFSLNTFAGLLKGGDSASPIVPGKPNDSLLIKKLKGTAEGMRMPAGNQPPFEPELIAKFEKWIAEGAKFDGPDGTTPVSFVASLAKAMNATHEELVKDRVITAKETWGTSMPDIQMHQEETENLLVFGHVDIGENTVKDLANRAEQQVPKVATLLGADTSGPLQKGRLTIFAVKTPYDFSEIVKTLIDVQDLPKSVRGAWKYNGIDAAAVIRVPRTDADYALEPLIAEQIAGAYVASIGKGTPRWFAEGTGRSIAASMAPRDPRVYEWDASLVSVFQAMKKADAFMNNGLDPEGTSVASYSFVKFLMNDKSRFNKLLQELRKGGKFDEQFAGIYGAPPAMVAEKWYSRGPGKAPKPLKTAGK